MAAVAPLLTAFSSTAPRFEIDQATSLAWLAGAHAEAARQVPAECAVLLEHAERAAILGDRKGGGSALHLDRPAPLGTTERAALTARFTRALQRCACPPSQIARRGTSFDLTAPWPGHPLYDLPRDAHGAGTLARTRAFGELADAYFDETYATQDDPPDELIHVTCTGYLAPSAAQKLVAAKRWRTRVTHAYHMGCYAAVPALRIAMGSLATALRVDIVHTELCSLHLDPADHRLEQLVVQSLFADGLIRYSVVPDDGGMGLRVRGLHECIVPDSADAMSWVVSDHGMQMTLARDVPERIAAALRPFLIDLFRRAGLSLSELADSVFAIHPGGPRIIDGVRDVLELDEAQVRTSREVLRDHGNMSSATLPHVWMRLLGDPSIPRGTLIPSLAFGPGLTVCGAVLEKR